MKILNEIFLWVLRGRPLVKKLGYHCGICGNWINEEIQIRDYEEKEYGNKPPIGICKRCCCKRKEN